MAAERKVVWRGFTPKTRKFPSGRKSMSRRSFGTTTMVTAGSKPSMEDLKRLRSDYVDLYLIHFPFQARNEKLELIMEGLHASGRTKSIGVSNFTIRHLDELLAKTKTVPAVNQVEIHPFLSQKELCVSIAHQKRDRRRSADTALSHMPETGWTTDPTPGSSTQVFQITRTNSDSMGPATQHGSPPKIHSRGKNRRKCRGFRF